MDVFDLFRSVTFKVAAGAERDVALGLRRSVYASDWPATPPEQVVDRRDEDAWHLFAVDAAGKALGSLRIVPPQNRPFDMEEFVGLDRVIPIDRSPAEIGRLSVAHGSRAVSAGLLVHLGLLKLGVELARRLGITDFLLTAIPSLREFYRRGGFADVNLAFEHPTWGPVQVMRLDLVQLAEAPPINSVARILLSPAPPNFHLPSQS